MNNEKSSATASTEGAAPHWRHRKRGTVYAEVGLARLQTDEPLSDMQEVLVYRDVNDGRLWARTPAMFHDGRFEPVEGLGGRAAAPLADEVTQLLVMDFTQGDVRIENVVPSDEHGGDPKLRDALSTALTRGAKAAAAPDLDAVRDKRMSELTPAQQRDAQELWIREQVGWLGNEHSRPHIEFLLERLDETRSACAAAQAGVLAGLRDIRQSLQFANDNPGSGISDTIWMMHRQQTVFDAIDELLTKLKAGATDRSTADADADADVDLNRAQLLQLVAMFGGDEAPETTITVQHAERGHSGPGVYAYWTDIPEEGAIFISDEGPADTAPEAASPAPVEPALPGHWRSAPELRSSRAGTPGATAGSTAEPPWVAVADRLPTEDDGRGAFGNVLAQYSDNPEHFGVVSVGFIHHLTSAFVRWMRINDLNQPMARELP